MVNAIISMGEYNRFSKGIYGWVGFKTKWLPYVNVNRVAGETKWSFWSLLLYSIDGIVAFSTAPLSLAASRVSSSVSSPSWDLSSSWSKRLFGATP